MTEPLTQTDPADATTTDWRRVHPLTPLIRSWQIVAVGAFFVAQDLGQGAVQGERPPWEDLPEGGVSALPGRFLAGGTAVFLLVLLVGAAWLVLSWRMTRYRVGPEALELHTGVLYRQQRRARLDRLQAVDISQPLLARITGLARLTLEVAGSGDSKVELAYLGEAEAQRLRGHLLARAAGVEYETEEAPHAPEHLVLEVTPGRLVASLALSSATVFLVLFVAALAVASVVVGSAAPAAAVVPGLLGVAGVLWTGFSSGFGFRMAVSPDGLRLRRGLLEQRAQTVPPGRVQALRLSQPLLWRGVDWWKIQVDVAGYGGDGDATKAGESLLLPVGTREEAVRVLALVVPDLGDLDGDDPYAVVDAGLSGTGPDRGWVGAPRAARWVDPLAWRRIGYRVTGTTLLTRGGWAVRMLDVVPHARMQSLGLTQGPLQRRLGLARFAVHSTPGPVSQSVPHLDPATARVLLVEQATRCRQARVSAAPERWMETSDGERVVPDGGAGTGDA